MYMIPINRLEGIDLILKALRSQAYHSNCLASSDLADGIERKLLQVDAEGRIVPVVPPPVMHVNDQGLVVPPKLLPVSAIEDAKQAKREEKKAGQEKGQRPALRVVK